METNCAIHWIEIYPVDSAIRRLNNRGLNSDLLLYLYSKQGFNLGICAHLKPDEVLICFNTTAYTCQITLGKTMAYKLTVFIYFSFIIYLFLSPFSPHNG